MFDTSKRIIFIGNYLSHIRGTKSVSESIAELLTIDGLKVHLVSKKENRAFRLFDIIINILTKKWDVVHIDVFSGNGFYIAYLSALVATIQNPKIILTLHGGALINFASRNNKLVQRLFKNDNYILSPSQYLISYFTKKGFEVGYLPNPINLERFPYNRSKVKKHSLLWVRGFSTIYNPQVPIHVLKNLLDIYPDATLTMVGPDAGRLKDCIDLSKELGIAERINFIGKIENASLFEYYQEHSVFLNTTSYESFGVSLVEAACCGIPIISNSVGEVPLIWKDGYDILLVSNNSLEEYISHIERIFESDQFTASLSERARLRAEKFNWEIIKADWHKLLLV